MDDISVLLDAVLQDGSVPRLWMWTDDAVVRHLDAVQVLSQRVAAARLVLIHEVEERHIPVAAGAVSAAAWLAGRYQVPAQAAAKSVKLAGVLQTDVPATASALASGSVNVEQVESIVSVVAGLPEGKRLGVEAALLVEAKQSGPRELGRCGRVLAEVADPVGAQRREERRLRAAARAFDRRFFTLSVVPGTEQVRVSGRLDLEDAAQVRAALDPLCAPRVNRSRRGRPSTGVGAGDTAGGSAPAGPGEPEPDADAGADADADADAPSAGGRLVDGRAAAGNTVDGQHTSGQHTSGDAVAGDAAAGRAVVGEDADGLAAGRELPDLRTPGQRRADALVDICRLALAGGDLPDNGGDRPQVAVTVPLLTLQQDVGTATLDDGTVLTAAAARRVACDAAILPVVLGGAGQVLDLGRERRLFTGPVRRALVLRDRGCAFPGCDRPPRWCAGHHIVHWVDGGLTDLANGVLVCAHHHRVLHHSGWEVQINPTDGLPQFIPPAYTDQQRRPIRNHCHD